METTSNQYLGTEPLGKLMRQYALPCMISLLVGALYNIVDQIFIANASYLGSYGNAANTVVFPLTVVALAIAVMVGDGCCAFVSISLGKGEQKTAKKSVGNSVVLILIFGIILTAVYLIFAEQIVAMFGGTVINMILDPVFIFIFKWGMMGAAVATVAGQVITALSMIREVVFGVGFALLLPLFFGLNGVLYSMPVSDILTSVIALFLIRGTYKELA